MSPFAQSPPRKSEAIYRLITENTVDLISLLDMNLQFTYVSPSVERILGMTAHEVAAKSLDQIMAAESFRRVLETFARELQAEGMAGTDPHRINLINMELYRKDGTTLWMESTVSFLRDEAGQPTGVIAVSRDITERRDFEERLREKSEELSALNRLARAVTAQTSREEVCQMAVTQVARTLQGDKVLLFSREGENLNLVAGGLAEECRAADFPAHRLGQCLCGLAVQTGKPIYVTDIAKEPRCTWEECRAARVRSFAAVPLLLGGEAIGLLGVASFEERDFSAMATYLETAADEIAISMHNVHLLEQTQAYAAKLQQAISERELSQQALEKREQELMVAHLMLKNVLNTVPARIFWKDREGRFLGCNPPFAQDAGFETPDQIIGKLDAELPWADHAERYHLDDLQIITSGVPRIGYEDQRVLPDGHIVTRLLSKIPLRNEHGHITGVLGTYQDITAHKLLEAQVQQSQKMEAIGTLAGGIAHDFNNILSAIMGYTEMALAEPQLQEPLQGYLRQVYQAGERARDLVKQILSFSRQGEGKRQPLKVSPIAKEVLKLLRASLPTTIEILQEFHADQDTILADATQIHQILMNLCTNAAQALPDRKGSLSVTLESQALVDTDPLVLRHQLPPGGYLCLAIADTGVGIPPELLNRIFDPFFTTKKKGEGTGMGLSVVHGIVTSHRGAVTVESRIGRGSTFRVYFPLLKDTEGLQNARAAEPLPRGSERILFVDAEETLMRLGSDMLTGLGYKVVGKRGSTEALETFRLHPDEFDLVVTDMTMPQMTGLELAQEILRLRPATPILLCTGFSEEVTPERIRALGLRELIMKPILIGQLAAAIRRQLD